ncbi:MAG: DUF364 domain-containing protein [Anaerolineae bacterium]|nr:DUF364 domain-containing protein [Anaerolineae bacterium]
MGLIEDLINTLPDGKIQEICVGAFWTAVVVDSAGKLGCGLASTMRDQNHHHREGPDVSHAGRLTEYSARELAEWACSQKSMEAAIGLATLNALLPRQPELWVDRNAAEVIAQHGAGKRVALVGHFPFIPQLQKQVDTLWVLEQVPQGADLPASAASEVIPQADVVAITGTTLINHTFAKLITLCRPEALVLVLGPTTPLSPILFDYKVDLLSGSVVENIPAVLRAVSQGANFRQVHRQGVRLVTMQATQ